MQGVTAESASVFKEGNNGVDGWCIALYCWDGEVDIMYGCRVGILHPSLPQKHHSRQQSRSQYHALQLEDL